MVLPVGLTSFAAGHRFRPPRLGPGAHDVWFLADLLYADETDEGAVAAGVDFDPWGDAVAAEVRHPVRPLSDTKVRERFRQARATKRQRLQAEKDPPPTSVPVDQLRDSPELSVSEMVELCEGGDADRSTMLAVVKRLARLCAEPAAQRDPVAPEAVEDIRSQGSQACSQNPDSCNSQPGTGSSPQPGPGSSFATTLQL